MVLSLALAMLVAAAPTEAVFVSEPVIGADAGAREAAPVLARRIASRVTERSGLPSSTSGDLRALADLEANRLTGGCADDSGCIAEIAAAVGARYVISTELRHLDNRWVLQLTLTDASTASTLGRAEATAERLGDLGDAIPASLDPLIRPLGVVDTGPGAPFFVGAGLAGVGTVATVGLGAWAVVLDGQLTDTTASGATKQFAYDAGWIVAAGAVLAGATAVAGAGLITFDVVGEP